MEKYLLKNSSTCTIFFYGAIAVLGKYLASGHFGIAVMPASELAIALASLGGIYVLNKRSSQQQQEQKWERLSGY